MGERYVRRRMEELGIPEHERGQPDYDGDGRWRAFDPQRRKGGANTTGAVVGSGVLNSDLLKSKQGGRKYQVLSFAQAKSSAFRSKPSFVTW